MGSNSGTRAVAHPSSPPPYCPISGNETSVLITQESGCTQDDSFRLPTNISSHLNLLSAGSLFLLPSILPFLASALTVYTATPKADAMHAPLHKSSSESIWTAFEGWRWETTWILLLPCIGVVIPLSFFKIMSTLEERSFQCRFRRWNWRRNNNTGSVTSRRPHACRICRQKPLSWMMTCPTVNAIKRAWRSLIGQPPGYGPLALDNSHSAKVRTASTSSSTWFLFTSSPSESELDSDPDSDSDSDATVVMDVNREDGGKQYRAIGAEKLSSFPRPKTILLTSLCIWTGLMVLSSSMGFNTPENQTPHTMNQLEQQGMQEGLFATDDREPMHNDEAQLRNIVVSWLETDSEGRKETEFAAWKADQDEVQEREEEPYATIKTNILILNKRVETAENQEGSINNAEVLISEDDEDFFLAQDEDAVDAMTMDLEDSAVFLNFLRQLEAEDQAARTTEEIQEQTQQQKQELVIKTTDELTVNSMIESQLPCGYNSKENAISNTWITEIMPEFIHRFLTRAEDVDGSETRQTGKAFVYHAWWTDLMILAVAMCLGGVLVGLAQSREVCEQLLERQRRQLSFLHEKSHPNRQRHIGASALSIVLSLVISASAMILTILMILAECWDVPSIYFSGIGIAGIILVHALIPDLQVDFLDSWEDDSEDSDGFDDEKSVSSMRGSWSPPMMERRNACSLEQSRRWESSPCNHQDSGL